MGADVAPSADKISADEFSAYLNRYGHCIEAISAARTSKPGDKTLAELDKYRYGDAISDFSGEKPRRQMGLEDVKTLVSWKLRHGKFRPTLMKFVSSNDGDFVTKTVKEAAESYRRKNDTAAALAILTKLKGIGPATASLLLAVMDPDRVIFFADEAFYWLCCGGKKESIKYNGKEYQDLSQRTEKLCKRLRVKAVDVEKVAFVIMRDQDAPAASGTITARKSISPPPTKTAKELDAKQESTPSLSILKHKGLAKQQQPAKRKSAPDQDVPKTVVPPERRSKRIRGKEA